MSQEEQRTYIFGNLEVNFPASKTPEAVQSLLSTIYPDLKTANFVDRGDYIEFVEKPATKGL